MFSNANGLRPVRFSQKNLKILHCLISERVKAKRRVSLTACWKIGFATLVELPTESQSTSAG